MAQSNIDFKLRQSVRAILRRAEARNQAGVKVMRARSKTATGQPFSGLEKVAVWLNATPIPGRDSRLWRQDLCGAAMYWHDYANTRSKYGWEVDHITPIVVGGTDSLDNLQALQWENNRRKGDTVGENYCLA
ncbi:MAG TPA: HNH endonuclease signature motif containing protein [Candidatus Saccharimonadales bacterium]|nr:HNH endonuclease signature motif containing protein [Candidatus Saccharimonadales bacterium]